MVAPKLPGSKSVWLVPRKGTPQKKGNSHGTDFDISEMLAV